MAIRSLSILSAALTLTLGCGGGGGGGGGAPPPAPPAPVNSSPAGVDDAAGTVMNSQVTIDVLANDTDPDLDTLTVTDVTQGISGTTAITVDFTITYTPNSGYTGHDSFSYTLDDGNGGTSQATVSVLTSLAAGQPIQRVSVATDGAQGDQGSWMGTLSGGGRFVAFYTAASTLDPLNSSGQILLRDRATNTTSIISLASGVPANDVSQLPNLSADGRFVAFTSFASDLVSNDANARADIFVHDRQTDTTTRVSVATNGDEADEGSLGSALSADGRFVAFYSTATNLDAADLNGTGGDAFIHDRQTGETTLVSVDSDEVQVGADNQWPGLSRDGRFVVFASGGQVYVRDRDQGTTALASRHTDGTVGDDASDMPVISEDGRFIAFASLATNLVAADTNAVRDVFVHDLQTGTTSRVSVGSGGVQGNAAVTLLNRPAISADGRFVAFISSANNMVGGDGNGAADAFVHDRNTGLTARVSVSSTGVQGNNPTGDAVWVSLSATGHYVAFSSEATNLVTGDTNGWLDTFVAPNPLAP